MFKLKERYIKTKFKRQYRN